MMTITGIMGHFKVLKIEVAEDPCPLKISAKHKAKIMATS